MMNLYMLFLHSILFNKVQDSKSQVVAKLFTSGDIELNPEPVTQGNNTTVIQSRLAQHSLRKLDGGSAGDCFF